VFNSGRIEQMATARELYTRPRTAFVARFVGGANVAEGEVAQKLAGSAQAFAIRAESVSVLAPGDAVSSGLVAADGAVLDVQFHGATCRWQVRLDAGEVFSATCNAAAATRVQGIAGERVRLAWPRESMVLLESA
jgi:putative spermidine/putrescine transport system ATP-binding protein